MTPPDAIREVAEFARWLASSLGWQDECVSIEVHHNRIEIRFSGAGKSKKMSYPLVEVTSFLGQFAGIVLRDFSDIATKASAEMDAACPPCEEPKR